MLVQSGPIIHIYSKKYCLTKNECAKAWTKTLTFLRQIQTTEFLQGITNTLQTLKIMTTDN